MTISKIFSLAILLSFSLQSSGLAALCQAPAQQRMPEGSGTATAGVVDHKNAAEETARQCRKEPPPPCNKPEHPENPDPEQPETPDPDTVTPTGEAAQILDILQETDQIGAFNRLFAASLSADSDNVSEEENATLQALADEPEFQAQAQEGILERTDRLYTALQDDAAQRTRFNTIYGTELPADGPPSDEDRTLLFSITGDPAYQQDAFLGALSSTGDLYSLLRTDGTDRAQFNALYGTSIAPSGELAASDRELLFSVAGDPAFELASFTEVLPATWGLFSALQSDADDRAAFNARYSTTLAASGAPSAADRTVLFGIAGDPNFNLSAFLESLEEGSGFLGAVQGQGQVSNFNLLFGATLPASGSTLSAADQQLLADLTGDPAFSQANFLTVLPRTAGLYSSLQANGSQRTQFNQLFGSSLAASGAPSAADRTILFGVAGDPAFNQANFITVLGRTASLHTALQNDEADRNAFNSQYGTTLQATGSPNANDRTVLFGVAGDPNFDQEAFLGSLGEDEETPPAGGSTTFSGAGRTALVAMQQDNTTDDFNRLFGTQLADTGDTGTAADVQLLADLTGDPAFSLPSFRAVLPVTGSLLRALQQNRSQREQFNSLFGTGLDNDDAPSGDDRRTLFDLTGDPAFEQPNFLQVLDRTARLLAALQTNAAQRANFNSQFDTQIGTGAPDAGDRGILFGLAGDPNFDLEVFLGTLNTSSSLATPINPNPSLPLLT